MAELVGGAILNAFFNVLFEKMATPEFMDLLVTKKLDRKLLQKLKTYLTTVNAVLYDAEYRQFALKDASAKYFLEDLRGAAYEADDLLDLIAYEVTAAEIQADQPATEGNLSWNLSYLSNLLSKKASKINHSEQVSIPSGVTRKIEEIVEILELLVKQIDPLGLKKNHIKDALPQREPTSPVVEDTEIFGRDSEVDVLFKLLQAADDIGIGVIPIFGMGGIGKTTLARLVYNDSKAKELFATRAWVCVSDNYDGLRIKKELLQQVNNSVDCDKLSPQQIDEGLKKSLQGKKYLIVLDDVWDNRYDNWNKLQVTLKPGAQGSKIIVTTRDKDIALMMGTVEGLPLSELNVDSCWQIFVKHAFNNEEGDQNVQSLREKILSKCGGLPLAAKMLGGVMRGKQVAQWDAILKSEMWEIDCGVIPALMLSYQYLPSHLKQCFAYCAIFPQDYRIRKKELIQLWMAECFVVKPRGGGDNIEELGEKYLQELVSRSFLQEHNDYGRSYFLMHDLINDLARHVSGEFLVRMDEDNSCEFSRRNRYFSFISKGNSSNMLGSVHKAQFLRTFWSFHGEFVDYMDAKKIVDEVVNDLRCLRVLSLRNFDVVQLPKSIKHLKHLRYLNLASTNLKRLPKTVCSLYNLQTLILYGCHQLVELPKNFGNLINLHFLDIRFTSSLGKMPPGMGNLNKIVSLELHRCKDCTFLLAFELPSLEHLSISSCDAVAKVSMTKPLCSLKTLLIREMKQWEEWIFCGENDPGKCGLLAKLEKLTIENCQKIKSLPDGMYVHLSSLKDLKIVDCEKLESFPEGGLPINLQSLEIKKCKKLESFPKEGLPVNLQSLEIKRCNGKFIGGCWQVGLQTLHTLSRLHLNWYDGGNLDCFSFPPALTSLKISSFKSLEFMNCKDLQHLTHLKIKECHNLKSFLQEGLESAVETERGGLLPKLQSLVIYKCADLIGRRLQWCLQRFSSLSYLYLAYPEKDDLASFPEELLLPSSLTSLTIEGFFNLEELNYKGLQHLTSLARLEILYCYMLRCLPEGLPSSLTFLQTWQCLKLRERCIRGEGKDWPKISHIPAIKIDRETI